MVTTERAGGRAGAASRGVREGGGPPGKTSAYCYLSVPQRNSNTPAYCYVSVSLSPRESPDSCP
eukprot:7048588-Alexandrium_andersonii.AAC.1